MIRLNNCSFLQIEVLESAYNNGHLNVNKVQINITPKDKENTYQPVNLQIQIYGCYEIGKCTDKKSETIVGRYFILRYHTIGCSFRRIINSYCDELVIKILVFQVIKRILQSLYIFTKSDVSVV